MYRTRINSTLDNLSASLDEEKKKNEKRKKTIHAAAAVINPIASSLGSGSEIINIHMYTCYATRTRIVLILCTRAHAGII